MDNILTLKKRDIKNVKNKPGNIRFRVITGESLNPPKWFDVITYQRFDTTPSHTDPIHNAAIMSPRDSPFFVDRLDLTCTGEKKLMAWINNNITCLQAMEVS